MKLSTKILGASVLVAIGFFNVSLLINSDKDVNLESLLKISSADSEGSEGSGGMSIYRAKFYGTVTTEDFVYNLDAGPDDNHDGYPDGCLEKITTVSSEISCIGNGSLYCSPGQSTVISEVAECVL